MKTEGCWYSQYYWIENEYTGEIICIKKDSPDGEEYRKELRELKIKEQQLEEKENEENF